MKFKWGGLGGGGCVRVMFGGIFFVEWRFGGRVDVNDVK